MSLFIRVDKFGASPRLLHMRTLSMTLGEDHHGIIACDNIIKPLFSVFAVEQQYLIRVETRNVSINNQSFPYGYEMVLHSPTIIEGFDAKFTLVPVSTTAEIIARSAGLTSDEIDHEITRMLPRLEISLAGMSRVFPIFENIPLSIGSDPDDPIFIDLDDVRPNHCVLTFNNGNIEIEAKHGEIAKLDTQSISKIFLKENDSFRLLPTGLELKLKFP